MARRVESPLTVANHRMHVLDVNCVDSEVLNPRELHCGIVYWPLSDSHDYNVGFSEIFDAGGVLTSSSLPDLVCVQGTEGQ